MNKIEVAACANYLKALEEISDDDSMEASSLTHGLEQVRALFYGTPFEKIFTDAIVVCDLVCQAAKEKNA